MSDYYSKVPFVRRLPAKCTNATVILQQGIPQIVRTDNGPKFNSKEFSEFSSVYGFKHVTSSPHYPRSNGFIESQVKIVKRTLEKVAKDNGDPHLALLYLRSTPVDSKLPSPAQLLQRRSFMDTLPKISSKRKTTPPPPPPPLQSRYWSKLLFFLGKSRCFFKMANASKQHQAPIAAFLQSIVWGHRCLSPKSRLQKRTSLVGGYFRKSTDNYCGEEKWRKFRASSFHCRKASKTKPGKKMLKANGRVGRDTTGRSF